MRKFFCVPCETNNTEKPPFLMTVNFSVMRKFTPLTAYAALIDSVVFLPLKGGRKCVPQFIKLLYRLYIY